MTSRLLPPMIGVVGWKNSGKTTLAARLIAEFTARGLRTSAIKHAHHGFDIDQEGRDSYRFREAGAANVAVVSSARWAVMHELDGAPEPTVEDAAEALGRCDIVVVEGYKSSSIPKVEARSRDTISREALSEICANVIAIACDDDADTDGLPRFRRDDVAAIADFISETLVLPRAAAPGERKESDALDPAG